MNQHYRTVIEGSDDPGGSANTNRLLAGILLELAETNRIARIRAEIELIRLTGDIPGPDTELHKITPGAYGSQPAAPPAAQEASRPVDGAL